MRAKPAVIERRSSGAPLVRRATGAIPTELVPLAVLEDHP